MGYLLTIVVVTAVLFLPIVGLLVVINLVSAYALLRDRGAPHPLLVMWRRMRGVVLPSHSGEVSVLDGRTAWVDWDIRWLAAGSSLARVVSTDCRSIELALVRPIRLKASGEMPAVTIDRARFVPRSPEAAAYSRSAVKGELQPALPGGVSVTATVVVYPEGVG